jgi:hypothetical protein
MERLIYSSKTRWWVLLFFLIPALTYTANGAYKGAFVHSCDLQHDWVAAKMVTAGENPYHVWLKDPNHTLDYFPESDCPEPLPRIAFLNTSLTAFLMMPFQNFEWRTLTILWTLLQFAFTILTGWTLMQFVPQPSRDRYIKWLPIVVLFGWFGTRHIFVLGQISMLIALLTFASILMVYRGRNVLAGILLGIALCKFTMIWALVLFFLAYRRYTTLAIAFGLQALGIVLMALATGQSLLEIPRSHVEIMIAFTGQLDGVVSLSRWLTEIAHIPETITFGVGVALSLWVTVYLFRHITFGPRRAITTVSERLEANLFAAILLLISLTFVYHRYQDMVLTLIVVVFWLNLTELPERSATQQQLMKLMMIPAALMLFANLMPPTLVALFLPEAVIIIEITYTVALVITLGILLWAALKYRGKLDEVAPLQPSAEAPQLSQV